MAEEKKGTEAQEKSGGSNKMLIIVLVIFNMLALGGMGAFAMMRNPAPVEPVEATEHEAKAEPEGHEAEESAHEPEAAVIADLGPTETLGSFVVNLNEPGSPRYLKATIKIGLENETVKDELRKREPQFRDMVIAYLSSLNVRQTQGLLAKEDIRNNILQRLNNVLKTGKLQRVYLTEFVIQ